MILLDTNICIYIINTRPPEVLARFHQYRLGDIGLSSVVAAELAFGVAKSASMRNRQALEMFLAPLEVLPFDRRPCGLMVICALTWSAGGNRLAPWTP
jgi:tRNA(fMet)-specific endonuclease VapC